jgi:preprotein translocase subunit SecE
MAKELHATADRESETDEFEGRSSDSASNRAAQASKKKKRSMTTTAHWLFATGLYKRNQGRITRQVTFGAFLFVAAYGAWRMSQELASYTRLYSVGIPLLVAALFAWVAYRLVNMPAFADFLIAVEAEMAKVSWPTRAELIRSSLVVIIVILGMAALLWAYDTFWSFLLSNILHVK